MTDELVLAKVDSINGSQEELMKDAIEVLDNVQKIIIEDDDQYEKAVEFGREIKRRMSVVKEFFEPMKKSAHEAHKNICNKEKEVLKPLNDSENILKNAIGEYVLLKEKERNEAEQKARELIQSEIDRHLDEAVRAEADGDALAAERAMKDARMAETVASTLVIPDSSAKVHGVSHTKSYAIKSIDETKVPVEINGVCIRPVDEKAVLRLIKASKGTLKIDGIEYEETVTTSFRK